MSGTKRSILVIVITVFFAGWIVNLPDDGLCVRTTTIQQGTFIRNSNYYGTVSYVHTPFVSTISGRIAQVHAAEENHVENGELLMRFDTQIEEQLLGQMIKERMPGKDVYFSGIEALKLGNETEYIKAEQQLRNRIQAAQVRSRTSGIIEAIYVQNGDYVQEGALLGTIRSEEKQIVLTAEYPKQWEAKTRCLIDGENEQYIAFLSEAKAPQADLTGKQMSQQLWFQPEDPMVLEGKMPGERISVEIVEEYRQNETLVPLSAVSSQNEIWIVEDGRAFPRAIDIGLHNDQYLITNQQLLGKTVILNPDEEILVAGCKVVEGSGR